MSNSGNLVSNVEWSAGSANARAGANSALHIPQADDHQEARLQGLSELYNVLTDPQLQYNVLLELMRCAPMSRPGGVTVLCDIICLKVHFIRCCLEHASAALPPPRRVLISSRGRKLSARRASTVSAVWS